MEPPNAKKLLRQLRLR